MLRNVALLIALAAAASTFVGCGSGHADVTGTVKMDGAPAPGLQVIFDPVAGGGGGLGTTDESGKYSIYYPGDKTGLPPGEYVVRLNGVEMDDAPTLQLPARYNAQSDLKRTVESGSNVFDFEVESK